MLEEIVTLDGDYTEIYNEAAERLRRNQLVAFPTETVYGLGSNGLSAVGVEKIFEIKNRPLKDPVILHVLDAAAAAILYDVDHDTMELMKKIQEEVWPGPLTIVAKASECVPDVVMAGTGQVAVRCPKHPVTRKLLKACGFPIAAPSANMFSRVSPTKAEHVKKYFASSDIMLISCDGACENGVESTVIRLVDSNHVEILRYGPITCEFLRAKVPDISFVARGSSADGVMTNSASPGQSIMHYSPQLKTYLYIGGNTSMPSVNMTVAVILDLANAYSGWKDCCLEYKNLCVNNRSQEVAKNLFNALHLIEDNFIGRDDVFLLICITPECATNVEYSAIFDRVVRAAAHRIIKQ